MTYLGFVGREVTVGVCQPFETNGEFDITRPDNVLDFEVLGRFVCVSVPLEDYCNVPQAQHGDRP
jgi:hypothetical protein